MNEEKELYSKEAVLDLSSMVIKYLFKAILELTENPDDFPSYDLSKLVEESMNNIPDEEEFIIDDIIEYLKNDSEFMDYIDRLTEKIDNYEKQKEERKKQTKEEMFEDEED